MARFRRIVQILFLFFFIFLFLRARYPYEVTLSSDIFLRFSPLVPLFYFIDNLSLSLIFWPALLILLLTIFVGRFFCGWICPLGTTLDIWNRIFKTMGKKNNEQWQKLRWIKFGILTASILLAIFSYNVWGYFDPLGIFTRITTVVIYPLLTLFSENLLILGAKVSFLQWAAYPVYDGFKTLLMPESQAFFQTVFWTILLLAGILALEKLSRRFWCRNICPAGALLGFLSQFRFYERIVGSACPVCNRCQTDCKMNAIPAGNVKETNKVECIECFNCGEKCPPRAKSITFRMRIKPYRTQPDFLRRQFLASGAAGLLTLGFFGVGLRPKKSSDRFIRPPGSLPENEFLDRCIRCLECVRICSSNGRCLQPAGFEISLLKLWTPLAVMREGYCEYNCNLCGQICPTDAILALSMEVKQQTPMGLAYFDKNLCIPFERNEDCIVCEEHCPTPDKAIKFDVKEAVLSDGTRRKVKYPYVVKELCIGCGICETKCPLPGAPGVYVTRTNEKRWESLPKTLQGN
jgi:polyferredoxin/ferredoxin